MHVKRILTAALGAFVVVAHASVVTLPSVYGIATGLPVAVFALAIAFGATRVSAAFHTATPFERFARPATGGILILVGIYESLRSIFFIL